MISQTENTVVVTSKVKISDKFSPLLDSLASRSLAEVKEMLKDRTKTSSKYFKSIPCVVAKSLITKYQKNKKCVAVKNIVIPICGDKGKQVKVDGNLLRVPVLFKKETIKIYPTKPIHGFIRQVEFFKRKREWFMSYTYNTKALDKTATGYLGVDRNQRDIIATIADLESGKVRRLGIDIQLWKDNLKRRKAKLQRKRKFKLLKKLKRKQTNRTKELNHKVSKQIVDYAKKHCKVIVLENLKNIKDSEKCGRSVQRSQWSYAQ